jgi:peptide/nickel transport system permease protein
LQAIPLVLIISIVLFALVNLAPGGPESAMGGSRRLRPEQKAALRRQFGLDKPLYMRYIYWLLGNDWTKIDLDGDGIKESNGQGKGIVRGDFGKSYRTRTPVIDSIGTSLKNTAYLMSVTLLIVAIIAIPVGVISAVKQYSIFDIVVTTLSFMGQAIPEFWLGLILLLIFYVWLKNPFTGDSLLPVGGMYTLGAKFSVGDWAKHLILPVMMGVVGWVTWYSRVLSSSMLDVIQQD